MEEREALTPSGGAWEEHFRALREAVSESFKEKPGHPAPAYLLELVRDMAGVFAMLMDHKEHRDHYLKDAGRSWLRTYQPCPWDWEAMRPVLMEKTESPYFREEDEVQVVDGWGPRPTNHGETAAWLALSKGLVWTTEGEKVKAALLHGLDGLTPFPKERPPYPAWEAMAKPEYKPLLLTSTFIAGALADALEPWDLDREPWDFMSAASVYRFLLPQEVRIGGGFPVFLPEPTAPFDEDLAGLLGPGLGVWNDLRLKGEIQGRPWEVSFGVLCGGLELNLDTKEARWAFDIFIVWGPMESRQTRRKAKEKEETRRQAPEGSVSAAVSEDTKRRALEWDEEDWTEWQLSIQSAIQEALPRFRGEGAQLQAHAIVTGTSTAALTIGGEARGEVGEPKAVSLTPEPGALTLTGQAPSLTITRPLSIPQEPTEGKRVKFLPVTLPEGPTRMDRNAKRLLQGMVDLDLPKDIMKAPTWEELVVEEAGRITEEAVACGEDPASDPRLKVEREPSGEERLVLSPKGRQALREKAGARGFREVKKDRDGLPAEWVVKHFRNPQGGYVETSLSWYSSALPLSNHARRKREEELEAALRAERVKGTPLLFDDLAGGLQAKIQTELDLLRSTIPNAMKLGDYILREFGRTGINPIRVSAGSLRHLLLAEVDPNGHAKVEAALKALTKLHFNLRITGDPELRGDSFGVFLGQVDYEPGGAGGHGEGTWTILLSPNALGVLRVFQQTKMKRAGLRQLFYYDWMKELDKEEKETLSEGWDKSPSTLIPFYDESHGFTEAQGRLIRFLESNSTLSQHGTRTDRAHLRVTKRTHPDYGKPRLYGSDFCPLIPAGVKLTGILGVKKLNAESGWRLWGTSGRATETSGARAPSLLQAMGVELPAGAGGNKRNSLTKAALEDLEAVVVRAMGGLVATLRPNGQWQTLTQAKLLPSDETGKRTLFFIFAPEGWVDRMAARHEEWSQERAVAGRGAPVKITREAPVAQGGFQEAVTETTLETEPLHLRLASSRKERKLTQAQAGALFGVSQQALGAWEKGTKPIPARLREPVLRWVETGEAPSLEG